MEHLPVVANAQPDPVVVVTIQVFADGAMSLHCPNVHPAGVVDLLAKAIQAVNQQMAEAKHQEQKPRLLIARGSLSPSRNGEHR